MMLQLETVNAMDKVPKGTIAAEEAALGLREREPILFAMDGMIRYAKAYEWAYESKIATDGALGDEYRSVITGLRGLLNGQGGVAMERRISTDSKDNGSIEEMFWAAVRIAGFEPNTF